MKKVKMKATDKIGYLTGKTKTKAGRTYHQIFFPYSDKEDKEFEKFWGKKRSKEDKGQYEWQKETMFEDFKMKTHEKYLKESKNDLKNLYDAKKLHKKSEKFIDNLFKLLKKENSFGNYQLEESMKRLYNEFYSVKRVLNGIIYDIEVSKIIGDDE